MSDYSLHFDGLQDAVSQMGTISRQLNQFLEELQTGTLSAIIEWESVARDEFDAQRNVWARGAADMTVQAANAQKSLDTIIANYSAGERAGYGIWNK